MKTFENIFDLIGNTPLVKIGNGFSSGGPTLLAKLEFQNPGGSVKDRMASHILRKAMDEGRLHRGDTIIDCTSGNTGVALAMVGAVLGLKVILTTPDKTSKEKVDLIKSYGAEVIVTSSEAAHEDPEGYYMTAINLAKKHGYFHTNQYHNPENPMAHYLTTGPEIWRDTGGKLTHLVAGIGTGGTLSGAAKYLKEKNNNIRTIAVDPVGSLFADFIKGNSMPKPAAYQVEGIGTDCLTEALFPDVIDEVITATDEDAFDTARKLARDEGLSVGGSSGAAIWAARKLATGIEKNALIVVIVPDSGTRYLSKCFNDDWMKEHGFLKDEANEKQEVRS